MKKLSMCLLMLLSFSFVSGSELYYYDTLMLKLGLSSGYTLSLAGANSRADYIKVDFNFFPENSASQRIIEISTSPGSEQKEDSLEFFWKTPNEGKYTFRVDAIVRTSGGYTKIKEKILFPIYLDEPGVSEYILPTEKIDINKDIIRQASELAQGKDDLFDVVFTLASWTKENINYNLTTLTAEASQKASWVLENRYGVCDEITNLFIAFVRALGIPARFVSGIAYSDSVLFDESWGLHGWAEVYFPGYGWVSFDPTYGQYGYVDAFHIKLKDSLDSDKSSSRFEWQGIGASIKTEPLTTAVAIKERGKKVQSPVSIEVNPLASQVTFGSYNLIEAKIKNNMEYYVALEAYLIKPPELLLADKERKQLFIKPFGEKTVYWIVQTDPKLDRGYIYTFPISIQTSQGYNWNTSFRAGERFLDYKYTQILGLLEQFKERDTKIYSREVEVECTLPEVIYANQSFFTECIISNKGNIFLKELSICMEQQCITEDIGISQSLIVKFNASQKDIGEKEARVTVKNKDVSSIKLYRYTVYDKPALKIVKVAAPEQLVFGPDLEISFELWKESMSKPENVSVEFWFNDRKTEWNIPLLESNQRFRVTLEKGMLNPKDNKFSIIVKYHDAIGTKYTEIIEKSVPLKEMDIFSELQMYLYKLGRVIEELFQRLG